MAIDSIYEIKKIISILEKRDASLYHACQLKDFISYVTLGGVPSREVLSKNCMNYTQFDTDEVDKKNNVWDKVFGNFSDFGKSFARQNTKSTPNPYGPIQIVFNPNILNSINDISITLRSAGAADFNRDQECLKNSNEFENIYKYPNIEDLQNRNLSKIVAFSDELNSRFSRNNCTSPEFNCKVKNGILSFNEVKYIIVDGYIYKNINLSAKIRQLTTIKVVDRHYDCEKKLSIIKELSSLIPNVNCSWGNILTGGFASQNLIDWTKECKHFHFNRFIKYLSDGTINT